MRRGSRLFELIDVLRRSRGPISAEAIAGELGVSRRTVYRDVAALMAQRVPIRGEAGVGYVLEAGFHMPPLMLTPDEVEAAILGAQWVETRGEPDLSRAAASLVAKLEAIAPAGLDGIFAETTTSVAPVVPPQETLCPSEIRSAIRSRNKIRISYRDSRDAVSDRIIWPVLLGYRDAGRIVAAWCQLRAGFRYFRTERILAATILDERIPRRMDHLRSEWRAAMERERQRFAGSRPPADDA